MTCVRKTLFPSSAEREKLLLKKKIFSALFLFLPIPVSFLKPLTRLRTREIWKTKKRKAMKGVGGKRVGWKCLGKRGLACVTKKWSYRWVAICFVVRVSGIYWVICYMQLEKMRVLGLAVNFISLSKCFSICTSSATYCFFPWATFSSGNKSFLFVMNVHQLHSPFFPWLPFSYFFFLLVFISPGFFIGQSL